MRLRINALAFIAIAFLLVTAAAVGQSAHKKQPFHPNDIYPDATWKWTKEAWTGDDAPYKAARLTIEQAASSRLRLQQLYTQYKTEAESDVSDPLAVFRWAYAAYEMTRGQDFRTGHTIMDGPQQALQEAPSPHTYDYDRIRFIVGEFYQPHTEAAPLARRLLTVNEDDYAVVSRLISILLGYVHPPINEATALCQQLKHLGPNKPYTYATIGFLYVIKYALYHQPADATNVVKNYQIYLKLAPKSEPFRKRALEIISEYQKRQ